VNLKFPIITSDIRNCSSKQRASLNFIATFRRGLIAYNGYQRRAKRTDATRDRTCLREMTLSSAKGGERRYPFFFFFRTAEPLSPGWNSRHYPRAVFTSEPRNKDHMYTSVSRETLSLDSYYRWWLIIRVYASAFVVVWHDERGKKREKRERETEQGVGNLVVAVFVINYSSACRFCFAGRVRDIPRVRVHR